MNAPQLVEDTVQVTLLASSGPSDLAAQTLSRFFGMTQKRAESVLALGSGVIAANVAQTAVRAAMPMLAALGVQIAVQRSGSEAVAEKHDLSIRLVNGFHAARLIRTLHKMIGPGNLPTFWFDGPAGMVLDGLTAAKAEWITSALRPISGVHVTASAQRTARHDLYCTIETDAMDLAALRKHLNLMGIEPGGFGDALASGLDRRALDHVISRFGLSGIFGINQDFARFDLLVAGRGSLSDSEFFDFLITRTGCTPNMVRKISAAAPMRIESCLTRAAARQFIADYATIGIPAFPRLIRN